MEGDSVLGVPGERVDEDVLGLVAAGEDAGQEDTVVVAVGLVAEDRDREAAVGVAGAQLLDEAGAGHAVADDNHAVLRGHANSPYDPRIESLPSREAERARPRAKATIQSALNKP